MNNNSNGIMDDIINGVRKDANNRLLEAARSERIDCLHKTVQALKELGTEREEIIRLLQKYWDLRRSEAESYLND